MKRPVVALAILALVAGFSPAEAATPAPPALTVETLVTGLDIPWDIAFLPAVGSAIPAGTMLYTERSRKRLTMRMPDGTTRVILDNYPGMWANSETGLMSVEPAANFATNREFLTCNGYTSGSVLDIRVVLWRFNSTFTSAAPVKTLVGGLPVSSGRHGGCPLLRIGYELYIGTGDAAIGKNPQYLGTAGGKVLRVDSRTGKGLSTNPFATSSNRYAQRIWTYGHRNVQGLARRSNGTVWGIEHGSYRDDEINRIVKKGNYGWNPVPRKAGDPSYNEGANSPMTDYSLPGTQQGAALSSGPSTIATSGGTFVNGSAWGSANGALAVCTLKDQSLRFLLFSSSGTFVRSFRGAALGGTYGRLRACVQGPDGKLYITTSNGGSSDKILRVTPH